MGRRVLSSCTSSRAPSCARLEGLRRTPPVGKGWDENKDKGFRLVNQSREVSGRVENRLGKEVILWYNNGIMDTPNKEIPSFSGQEAESKLGAAEAPEGFIVEERPLTPEESQQVEQQIAEPAPVSVQEAVPTQDIVETTHGITAQTLEETAADEAKEYLINSNELATASDAHNMLEALTTEQDKKDKLNQMMK